MNFEKRQCKNCKNQFTIEPEDFVFYEKIGVPPPTFCPDCRLQRRMLFRNERTFYKRTCDLCKKDIISSYAHEYTGPVYCQKCWWSDKWDPFSYGRDFDFSKPFFEQFRELLFTVPAISLMNDDGISSINSEYSYDWFYNKNSYLTVCGWQNENVMYSYHADYDKDVADCLHVDRAELTYESISSFNSYNCRYCMLCFNCNDCILSYDLRGCSHCTMSVGLRNKSYYILNKPYTKEGYLQKLKELNFESRRAIERNKRDFLELKNSRPHRFAHVFHSVRTTGDVVFDCKNTRESFYAHGLENSGFIVVNDTGKELYDCNNTGKGELCYEGVTPDEAYNTIGTVFCFRSRDTAYSQYCHSSENLFGCVSIQKGAYAILNKRYSKDDYEKLHRTIVENMKSKGEWGEFFPQWISPFAYNESTSQEWFPLSEDEARVRGFRWRTPDARNYTVTMSPDRVPDTISEVTDDILNQVIGCEHNGQCNEVCTTAFRIIPMELEFYRKMDIPLPVLCPNCRHYRRLKLRNPAKLWHRTCQCAGRKSEIRSTKSETYSYENTATHFHGSNSCLNGFETTYAPERPEIVYCEQCYQSEVA